MNNPILHRRILFVAIKAMKSGHQVPKRNQTIDTDIVFKQQNRLMARAALANLNGLASHW